MSAKEETNHAKEQAKAQVESIAEMVANLTREGAAETYCRELERERIIELLEDIDDDSDDEDRQAAVEKHKDDDTEDLREELASAIEDETIEPDDFEFDEDEARQTIQEDALSVQVRGGWHDPGAEDVADEEFEILLCTGGPAVRIVGDLDRGSPSRPRIEYQDWGTPWTEYFPTSEEREALQAYCEQFYYGE